MNSRTSAGQTSTNNKQNRKSDGGSTPRRRSARLSANEENIPPKAEAPCVPVKRSITVRKIVPRKTQATSELNKENVEKRLSGDSRKRSKVSSPPQAETTVSKPTILSPIQAPASPSPNTAQPEQDPVWSHKVRRSYSRLSIGDRSFESPKPESASSPTRRETMFGFERLQTPEVIHKANVSRGASSSMCIESFNLSAADDTVANTPEPDLNIPGVCLVKKNARRKRVQQIKTSELDILAAQMNAEFEEAECFELVVE
ncbi:sororin [Tachysurus fulvidraco]|uniref:sororin n=1 Tax=Tachysurus fulvidraco TaxID=1234273 RepID=UPI001FED6936|nr:sororin [Tachysurus fulvidraco]